jgi:hypothetical protein
MDFIAGIIVLALAIGSIEQWLQEREAEAYLRGQREERPE